MVTKNTTNDSGEYTFIGRPVEGEHKFFRKGNEIYVVDDSGYGPEDSDDGPLQVQEERGWRAGLDGVTIEVFAMRKRGSVEGYKVVMLHHSTALWLKRYYKNQMGVRINIYPVGHNGNTGDERLKMDRLHDLYLLLLGTQWPVYEEGGVEE